MAKVNLGRVGFVMQGNHSTSKTYKRLDCVTSNGVMYSAKEDVPTGIAINNETYWQKIFDGEEVMDSKMERYVIKLTKNGETYSLTDIDNQAVTFNSLYSTLRDLSKYVVCVYGNSKLRPQYVSTNEMLFIGLDRASSSSKVLRMHVTPTAIRYETFELAEKLYVDTELNKKASAATMAAFAQNLGNLEGDVDELKSDIAHQEERIVALENGGSGGAFAYNYDEGEGYLDSDGNITTSVTPNVERYTNRIDVEGASEITFALAVTDTTKRNWCSYVKYNASGTKIGARVLMIDAVNDNFSQTVDVSDAAFIVFSYRTYGVYHPVITVKKPFIRFVDDLKHEDVVNRIETLESFTKAVPYTTYPGYFGSDGDISPASATSQEVYTNFISRDLLNDFVVELKYTEKRSMWFCYLTLDNTGKKVRNTIYSNFATEYSKRIQLAENIVAVAFTWRTYGESNINIWVDVNANGIISDILLKMRDNGDNHLNPYMLKPCYDHLFADYEQAAIPHESLFHVRLSHRMGFNMIECNLGKTSDGVFVVNHFNSGKFGKWFHHVDGVTDIKETLVSSVTWAWIVANVRYNSVVSKHRTRPYRLEEVLAECKKNDMIPFVTSNDAAAIAITEKVMGKNHFVAYGATRANCPEGIIYHWRSETTKQKIIDYCNKIGKPFIYGMANPAAFSSDALLDIVQTLHQMGYMIGTSYQDANWSKYSGMGFDFNGTQYGMNRIDSGTICNFDSTFGYGDFTITGAVENDGELVFADGGTIAPNYSPSRYDFCGVDVEFDLDGSVTIPRIGEHRQATYQGSGESVFVAFPLVNATPKFTITVAAGTRIKNISFKATQY